MVWSWFDSVLVSDKRVRDPGLRLIKVLMTGVMKRKKYCKTNAFLYPHLLIFRSTFNFRCAPVICFSEA